jgi:protein tyrosine phosphatase (PTP) superfamily phosphohydrolase (DUF442 family)
MQIILWDATKQLSIRQIGLHCLFVLLCVAPFDSLLYAAENTTLRNPTWAKPIDVSSNLFQVDQGFYRNEQLQDKDIALLQALGVKTVLNLRSFHSDDDLLKGTGIESVRVPINTWAINDNNVSAALKALRAAQKEGPVILHCLHGADRTGLVTAMYRVLYQNWSKEVALKELTEGGYGYHAMWTNIPTYFNAVDIEKIRVAVEK